MNTVYPPLSLFRTQNSLHKCIVQGQDFEHLPKKLRNERKRRESSTNLELFIEGLYWLVVTKGNAKTVHFRFHNSSMFYV